MRLSIGMPVSLGGVVACGTGPDQPATLGYFLNMNASISDTTPERIRTFSCGVSGIFHLPSPAPATGTVRFSASVIRTIDEQPTVWIPTFSSTESGRSRQNDR
jgi:hypothetical protein